MSRPDQGLIYQGLSLANGGYTIIELSAVISNNTNVNQTAIDNLESASASAAYQSVVKLLSDRAEVTMATNFAIGTAFHKHVLISEPTPKWHSQPKRTRFL